MIIIGEKINGTRKQVTKAIQNRHLYIDPLITAIATDTQSGPKAFDTMRKIKNESPVL